MADTPKPAVKEYYDYAQEAVDEQAILDKYNAATAAQFAVQREQNRQNENAFYNQMYNTQKTAMDTIRQSNAAAVSTGASRGVQAANELSALLGLQQESVQSATELAQANRQTAQEETAAVLENVLKAYQQAQQERDNIITQGIQAESVAVEEANVLWNSYLQAQANGDSVAAAAAWEKLQGTVNGTLNPGSGTPVYESAINADGTMVFSTADLNDKNVRNIYSVLNEAGYETNKEEIIDINNTADYDLIDQVGFDSSKQKGKAAEYIRAIQNDVAANKIPVGSIVQLNYGTSGKNHIMAYLGNGKFARIKIAKTDASVISNKIYVPQGYRIADRVDVGGTYRDINVKKN